ncbi:jg6702 [Pararge aegeria aegeria]|uniref:Jg6702 protein n=1 Tax=Pararge aegeria aegeria TaxID=348720 RepID=A0A8S4SIQ7_9NEOP|nr:jg6702 [Pararge aegeria aegeria]
MLSGRTILAAVIFTILISTCNCSMWQEFFKSFYPSESGRSMSDAIANYLDYLFPKDDQESRIMKEIFGFFSDDTHPGFEGSLDALDYLLK